MTGKKEIDGQSMQDTLKQQRILLREQLSAQRRVYMQKLLPISSATDGSTYPRSRTMRFLNEHPDMARKLLGQAALLTMGGPVLKSLLSGMALARLLHGGIKR